MKVSLRPRRRLFGAAVLFAALLILSGCSAMVLPEGWAGIAVDGKLVDGRYEDLNHIYVAYRDVIFRFKLVPRGEKSLPDPVLDWAAHAPGNAPMFAAPALGPDGTVYEGTYNHSLYAFLPSALTPEQPLNTFTPVVTADKVIGGALVYNKLVYLGQGDKGIRAYDAQRGGEPRLKYEGAKGGTWSTPLIDSETGTLYFGSLDHNLYALSADDLSYRWQVDVGGSVGTAPLLDNGILYVGTFSNKVVAINTKASPPKVIREFDTEGWVWATPVMKDGTLYFGDLKGWLYALDTQSWQLRWKARNEEMPGGLRGQVAVVDDKVIVGSEGKFVRAYDQKSGGVVWTSSPTEDRVMGDMVVVGSDVITTTLSENQLVVAYDLNTGGRSWMLKKPSQDDVTRLLTVTPAPK